MDNRPNIVIIMTDQQRADLRKGEGYPLDTMPFLDSMAREGVDFEKAYTSMPACVPARVSMFTGRFPEANHVKTNHNTQDAYFEKDLLGVLKDKGYVTGLSGKNHTYLNEEDFDYWYTLAHTGGNQKDRSRAEKEFDQYLKGLKSMTDPKPTAFPLECQGPYRSVTRAMEWINGMQSIEQKPFFLWLSFAEPHNPYQVPEPYFSMFPPEALPTLASDKSAMEKKGFKYNYMRKMWERVIPDFENTLARTRSNYLGMLKLIDDQIKRFVDFLENKQLKDNTIIIFLADHGDFAGEYGLIRKGPELPEVLCRIPMIFTGAGIVKNEGRHEAHVSIVDIMPTICEAIGMEIPNGVQGRSLWPMLTGNSYPGKEFESVYCEHGFGGLYYNEKDTLDPVDEGATGIEYDRFDCLNSWTQAGTARMLRKGDWKLIYDMEGKGQLYNIKNDPVELNNLFGMEEVKEIQLNMLESLLAWTLRAQDPLPYPRKRYVMKTHKRNYLYSGEEGSI